MGCPLAFFDTLLLNQLNLLPLSQRRIEFLQVQPDSLDTVQTHQILERLEDASLSWEGQSVPVRCYRTVDSFEKQERLWTNREGICLLRGAAPDSQVSYRLLTLSA